MQGRGTAAKTAVVVGASRTIGLALTNELLRRDWNVVATVRRQGPSALHELAASSEHRLTIAYLDMTKREQISALRARLDGTIIDLLFVNAAITNGDHPIEEVSTDAFVDVMVTNALSPMLVVEGLSPIVKATGTMAVMSSRQGSVSLNTSGGHEVYRASKSALNQLMRSYAARHHDTRTLLLIHPGWVNTDLGGPGAPLTVNESAHGVIDVLERHSGQGGLDFRDYRDEVVAW